MVYAFKLNQIIVYSHVHIWYLLMKLFDIFHVHYSLDYQNFLQHIVNGTAQKNHTDNLNPDDIEYLYHLIKKCELHNFLDGKAENTLM